LLQAQLLLPIAYLFIHAQSAVPRFSLTTGSDTERNLANDIIVFSTYYNSLKTNNIYLQLHEVTTELYTS